MRGGNQVWLGRQTAKVRNAQAFVGRRVKQAVERAQGLVEAEKLQKACNKRQLSKKEARKLGAKDEAAGPLRTAASAMFGSCQVSVVIAQRAVRKDTLGSACKPISVDVGHAKIAADFRGQCRWPSAPFVSIGSARAVASKPQTKTGFARFRLHCFDPNFRSMSCYLFCWIRPSIDRECDETTKHEQLSVGPSGADVGGAGRGCVRHRRLR